jgi:hypothetical protein
MSSIIVEESECEILAALRAAGLDIDADALSVKIRRRIGTGKQRGSSYITELDYVPTEQELADTYGEGNYLIVVSDGQSSRTATVRIDASAVSPPPLQFPMHAVPPASNTTLLESIQLLKEIQSIMPQPVAPPHMAMPDVMGMMQPVITQMGNMVAQSMKIATTQMQQQIELMSAEFERRLDEIEDMYDSEESDTMQHDSGIDVSAIVEQVAPLLSSMLPQVLQGNAFVVGLIKAAPEFIRLRKNPAALSELIAKLALGATDITRLSEVLDIPPEVLPHQ